MPTTTGTPTPSHGQQLAEARLGRPFHVFVAELKAADPDIGWRSIATALYERTGITVTHMTVRAWATKRAA